ncbi:zinc-type alcohol dehydrogenase-like protein [Colletotrichum spaethianum]|uniref:Zinc-type alcohol dehydrogenase-like protein n=1 Tax=Colletotrichum spaethianum TaxID=700344 RepID=A0AA37PFW6_9PEZI|nr:zinc-type alcohol dehydrogenase-like protein [Colletotrichum spaethianum]GKT51469.1 zinc-type alcohol dehydrogenase-like protein [Colletotrichum spaethianum]
MTHPTTSLVFRRTDGDLPRTIEQSTEALPAPDELGSRDVLIKIHAVSLNFRDVAMLNGRYPVEVQQYGIPCSDCAAEVIAVGPAVQDFVVGDRVAPIFDLNNLTGHEDKPMRALGGDHPGVLREYAVFDEEVLVHLPKHLTWEEAATLTCAGVTAWNALDTPTSAREEAAALLQGTGGVSLFALLLCLASGIKPIITSSSDEKLVAIKKLGSSIHGINYKTTTDQKAEILQATNGKGVDFVVNNTGPASIPDDIGFLRQRGGTVSLVGFLEGGGSNWEPGAVMALMSKAAKLKYVMAPEMIVVFTWILLFGVADIRYRGVAVGSKLDYERMNDFLQEKNVNLGPIIDRVFPFQDSKAAFEYLYSGKHVGKVVIKL